MPAFRHLLFLLALPLIASAQESAFTETSPETIPPAAEVSIPPAEDDQAIKTRLNAIFQEIEDLSQIQLKVNHGVVTLSGPVPSGSAQQEALALAERTEGVIYVRDRLEEELQVEKRLKPAAEKAQELLKTFTRKLPLIAIALSVIAIFWFVGRVIGNRRSLFRKAGLNELSAGLLGRVIRLLFLGLGIFIALEILDATAVAAGILGVAGVAGVALGFAFRNIVENYLAGILLSLRNPFSSGDLVEIGEHLGKVIRLTSRDTVLMTLDGNHLRIPNSVIITSALTNFSRNPLRRFDFAVGVSTDLDLVRVRDLGLETMGKIGSILQDPGPFSSIEALGDSTVNMKFFGWVDQRESDFTKTKSEAIRLVKDAFDEAEIEMPEPIYRVHLHQLDPVPPPSRRAPQDSTGVPLDTSVDDTLERQLAEVYRNDGEENLLDPSTP